MTFILPTALCPHTQSALDNVGTAGSVTDSFTGDVSLELRSKSGGNLPITDSASRVQYSDNNYGMGGGAAQGVFFGMSSTSQQTIGSVNATDPLLMIWSVQFNSPNRIQVADQAAGGVRFWVGSGSTPYENYREYYIGGNDTPFASAMAGPVTICVDLNASNYENSVGTFVATNVSAYGIATVHESISGTQFGEIHCQRAHLLQASASSATKPIPFFLTNPIVSPETFATCGVEILSNGDVGDTLQVDIDTASFTYTLVTNDAIGNTANTAISFVAAWNASSDSDVSDYTATHDGGGRMIFTHDTAVSGEVLYPMSSPSGNVMFTSETTGATGATYTPLTVTNFDSAVTAVQGLDYSDKIGNWLTKTGSTYFIPVPFAFGNGVQPINFTDNNVSVESPANAATGQKNFRTESRTMAVFSRVRLDSDYAAGAATSSYDSISLGGTYTWGTNSPWDFNIDGTKSNVALSGTFKGMGDITMGSTVTASGAFTLDSGAKVISSGADISDINITGNLKILGKTVTTFNNVDCSGNITFSDDGEYSFTGQGSLGGTFVNDSGSNITINIAIGVAYTNNNADSSITINQVTKTLTLTGLVTGTEVRVYDSTTFAALGGIEDSASSGIFTMNLTSNQVDIVIHHIEYVHIRLAGIDSTESINTPIVQRLDRGYSA